MDAFLLMMQQLGTRCAVLASRARDPACLVFARYSALRFVTALATVADSGFILLSRCGKWHGGLARMQPLKRAVLICRTRGPKQGGRAVCGRATSRRSEMPSRAIQAAGARENCRALRCKCSPPGQAGELGRPPGTSLRERSGVLRTAWRLRQRHGVLTDLDTANLPAHHRSACLQWHAPRTSIISQQRHVYSVCAGTVLDDDGSPLPAQPQARRPHGGLQR